MDEYSICRITGREVLDSRGNPTVEAEVELAGGAIGRGIAPSGASTGSFEALELRDGDKARFGGKGVSRAVSHVSGELNRLLTGQSVLNQAALDRRMQEADGTPDKSRLGANAILAVSLACAHAGAHALHVPLFRYLGGVQGVTLPVPMMNILNGGAHADNGLDVQEFMILPVGAPSFSQGLRQGAEVYHALASLLKQQGLSVAVGDEGGFAPAIDSTRQALELISRAIELAGYTPGRDFLLALDAAASEWKGYDNYRLPKSGTEYTASQLIEYWKGLTEQFPICSIEDPLGEEDWEGWAQLTAALGERVLLVGDDLFVTNESRLVRGMEQNCGNAILIKPNQIGTVSETMDTVRSAGKQGFRTILSHRSGESEDTSIADLAVALNAGFIKTGAPCRTERTAKYNRLLRIESLLGRAAVYPGTAFLPECFR